MNATFRAQWLSLLPLLIIVGLITGCGNRLDNHLCPIDKQPERQTVLLLDTSDPLTPKHRSELRRLLQEMLKVEGSSDSGKDFYIAPGEALIVYELTQTLDDIKPALRICNPGNDPDKWTWKDDFTQGRAIALHQWQRLDKHIESLFDELQESEIQQSSPILEMTGVILPRHAPSKRSMAAGESGKTHLIVFSDLLQHSDLLSHYGPYPAAKEIRTTNGLRVLQTDLTGIDVSLFRLERAEGGRWQTRDHYYWWTELVAESGGRLIWQDSI